MGGGDLFHPPPFAHPTELISAWDDNHYSIIIILNPLQPPTEIFSAAHCDR